MYIGYFDEFGHIGAYKSRQDPHLKTHPVFGIGGFIIPANNVRTLSAQFRNLKEKGLKAEIEAKVVAKGKKIEHWEKKGSALLTTQNIRNIEKCVNSSTAYSAPWTNSMPRSSLGSRDHRYNRLKSAT